MDSNCKKRRCDDSYEELSIKLSDQSVLECPICFDPLTFLVYQCANGHIICSSCQGRLKPKCPSCRSDNLGDVRNLAVEKILESVIVTCSFKSFGCCSELTYSSNISYEKSCPYSPYSYSCPVKGCNFLGSPTNLTIHLKKDHPDRIVSLDSDMYFSINKAVKFAVFVDDENDTILFILNTRTMEISSIQDSNLNSQPPPEFWFSFMVKQRFGCFEFKPVTIPCLCANDVFWKKESVSATADSKCLLRVLDQFFEPDGKIEFEIRTDQMDGLM